MNRLNNSKNIKLAVPNKGRLMKPILDLLEDMDLRFDFQERRLYSPCTNFNLDLLFLRAADIPRYVENGVVDIGMTGTDLIEEEEANTIQLLNTGLGRCSLVLATPLGSLLRKIENFKDKKIATSFPVITKKFFKNSKINVKIIEVEGAAEVTPWLGIADAIVDIVSTGETMNLHNLKQIQTVYESEVALIRTRNLDGNKKKDIEKFVSIMQGVLNGRQKKYLMMNAPETSIAEIKRIIPGLKSPTILKLAQPGMIAIHSVVDAEILWDIIPKLKNIGASGILVSPIEKLVY